MLARYPKLCLVTHLQDLSFPQYEDFLRKAIKGGVTAVQLRTKGKKLAEVRELAIKLKFLLEPLKVDLIINDHVKIAKDIDADGVHVGQGDVSPLIARQLLGPDKIIGVSIETLRELEIINRCYCVDYIAASSVFASKSKQDGKTVWELAGLRKIVEASHYPVIAIGGINVSNIAAVMNAGAQGVAVIEAIHNHPDPEYAASELRSHIS